MSTVLRRTAAVAVLLWGAPALALADSHDPKIIFEQPGPEGAPGGLFAPKPDPETLTSVLAWRLNPHGADARGEAGR